MSFPDRITISSEGSPDIPNTTFTVIADGTIHEHLGWDEMLGQVASLTLTGRPIYSGFTLGDPNKGHWWKERTKLLAERSTQ